MHNPNAIKLALLVLLGIAIGAVGAANIVSALRQRNAYPRGLMNVMQHHLSALHADVRSKRCGEDAASHLAMMHNLAGGIETAIYADDAPEASFHEYDQRLRAALDSASASTAECAALAPTLDKIGAACDACHREYR